MKARFFHFSCMKCDFKGDTDMKTVEAHLKRHQEEEKIAEWKEIKKKTEQQVAGWLDDEEDK